MGLDINFMNFFTVATPLGKMRGKIEEDKLSELIFSADSDAKPLSLRHPLALMTQSWLDNYFKGQFDIFPEQFLGAKGTLFQKRVWKILLTIAAGEKISYAAVARLYARQFRKEKMWARPIGAAIARNPILLIIPCHRVICGDGAIGGYSGGEGPATKIKLLEHEKTAAMI